MPCKICNSDIDLEELIVCDNCLNFAFSQLFNPREALDYLEAYGLERFIIEGFWGRHVGTAFSCSPKLYSALKRMFTRNATVEGTAEYKFLLDHFENYKDSFIQWAVRKEVSELCPIPVNA
jgi:hypothetical protein